MSQNTRHILVVSYVTQPDTLAAAVQICQELVAQGAVPVLRAGDAEAVVGASPTLSSVAVLDEQVQLEAIDCAIVAGGDGTILRAAELLRGTEVPLVGVNFGHVGFLAEAERDSVADTVRRVLAREFEVDSRLTLAVRVVRAGHEVFKSWALNESTVEKGSRERMLEVVVEVDRRPLSTFGCDGVVVATPTGSTAYAFSAGGPVVWPEVDALVMVPLSAHALFSRPLVLGPSSVIAIEIVERAGVGGVLWCDGRRTFQLEPGDRIEVTRSDISVPLARLHPGPFTDRLVTKFDLPVQGWRGPSARD
jgi:NAD+ kinase